MGILVTRSILEKSQKTPRALDLGSTALETQRYKSRVDTPYPLVYRSSGMDLFGRLVSWMHLLEQGDLVLPEA